MKEKMALPAAKSGRKREAVFTKGVPTELSDADVKHLESVEGGFFLYFVDKGIFIVKEGKNEVVDKSKLEYDLEKLQKKKAGLESKGKQLKKSETEKLKALEDEWEKVKNIKGE